MSTKRRELTEMQQAFLDALLGPAEGDYNKALAMAGYSEGTRAWNVVSALKEEILEATMHRLALKGPRAAFKLEELLENPDKSGASNTIKVAKEILDRVGAITTRESVDLKVPQGGLIIMPAKGSSKQKEAEDEDQENDD